MSITKMDPAQIQRASFDEEQMAVRVLMSPTEIAIELNHEDGDSVYSHKKMQVIECVPGQIIDTSLIQTICSTTVITFKAIVLGEEVGLPINLQALTPKEICLPAIKVTQSCKLILRG